MHSLEWRFFNFDSICASIRITATDRCDVAMDDLKYSVSEMDNPIDGQLQAACEHLTRELIKGVRHGFSEMIVTVEIIQGKRRVITIRGGRSYRFFSDGNM
jgi:hypothetical protein